MDSKGENNKITKVNSHIHKVICAKAFRVFLLTMSALTKPPALFFSLYFMGFWFCLPYGYLASPPPLPLFVTDNTNCTSYFVRMSHQPLLLLPFKKFLPGILLLLLQDFSARWFGVDQKATPALRASWGLAPTHGVRHLNPRVDSRCLRHL